jgi:hypothetical protein
LFLLFFSRLSFGAKAGKKKKSDGYDSDETSVATLRSAKARPPPPPQAVRVLSFFLFYHFLALFVSRNLAVY